MLTPEQIEATNAWAFPQILELGRTLHTDVLSDLTLESPIAIEEKIELREKFIIKIAEAMAALSSEIEKQRALKKQLEIAKMMATSDKRTLTSKKFDCIRIMKDNNL